LDHARIVAQLRLECKRKLQKKIGTKFEVLFDVNPCEIST
jgi:hypothetical protein